MHELSVAQRLVELVSDELAGEPSLRVRSVRLRLGPLSGVVAEALLFAYDAATAGTALEGSTLEIERVTPAAFCPKCRKERELSNIQRLRCPVCHTPTPEVVRGRELEVLSVEVSDPLVEEQADDVDGVPDVACG
jgi:hydrogenase nickel incorporation protein HypA/HybF